MNETPNTAGRGRRRAPFVLRWARWGAATCVLLLGAGALVLSLLFQINAAPDAQLRIEDKGDSI